MSRQKSGNRHENLVGIGLVDPGVGPKSRSVGTRRTVKRRARLQSGHDRLHHRSRGVCEDAPSPEVIYFSLGALGVHRVGEAEEARNLRLLPLQRRLLQPESICAAHTLTGIARSDNLVSAVSVADPEDPCALGRARRGEGEQAAERDDHDAGPDVIMGSASLEREGGRSHGGSRPPNPWTRSRGPRRRAYARRHAARAEGRGGNARNP